MENFLLEEPPEALEEYYMPDVREEPVFLKNIYRNIAAERPRMLLQLAGSIWVACRMNAWYLDLETGKLLQAFSAHANELMSFFTIGKCLDYVREHRTLRMPFLLSDPLGLMWIAEIAQEGSQPYVVVFGPSFPSGASPIVLAEKLRSYHFSISLRSGMEEILRTVPILPEGMLHHYARMLHFTLTGETCTDSGFYLQKARVEQELFPEEQKNSYEALRGDKVPLEKILWAEANLLSFVEEGRADAAMLAKIRDSMNCANYTDGDLLQDAKYDIVILAALFARAAVKGGLPVRIARTKELQYIRMVHQCKLRTEVKDVNQRMLADFIGSVRACREAPGVSESVQLVCDYVKRHVNRKIDLEEIASSLGYTKYYLTKKFAAEMGMKFFAYVNQERIKAAKALLRDTGNSVQDIAASLQYETPSYFNVNFKRETGMSPAAYRKAAKSGMLPPDEPAAL